VVTAEKKIPVYPDIADEDETAPRDIKSGVDTSGDVGRDEPDAGSDSAGPTQAQWDIGPEGGTFRFDGGLKLIVPPDAFAEEITVEAGIMGGATAPEDICQFTDIWIIPDHEDLVFNLPVLVVLPLLEEVPTELPEGITWDQLGGFTQLYGAEAWEKLPASLDLLKGELSIPTTHFSLFFGGLGGGGTSCTPEDEVCNGQDDDCDGEIDEGSCAAGEACFQHAMCAGGTCAWVYGGEGAVCAETEGGCVILVDDAPVHEEDQGIICTGDTTYRLCQAGIFSESTPCSEGFEDAFLCDEELGECVGECGEDADCEDLDLCDGGTACLEGQCVPDGQPVVCPGDTQCSTWICVFASGLCEEQPANTGDLCEDGDPCTEGDVCAGLVCVGGAAVECGDGNACTADSCDPATGDCVYDAVAMNGEDCDDADPCTEDDVCDGAGGCAGTDKDCDDQNGCTADSCDGFTGDCSNVPLVGEPCDDADECTEADACTLLGTCEGVPAVDCDDLNDCTVDWCDPEVGICTHTLAEAGIPCAYPDSAEGSGSACYPDAVCDDAGACQPGGSLCECLVDGDCPDDDGDLCNGVPKCDTETLPFTCVEDPDSAVECGPGGTCFELLCAPSTGDCFPLGINEGAECDDEDVCTTGEACTSGQCTGGALVDCDDADPCTLDTCDPTDGCGHSPAPALPCDDGDVCTEDTCTEDGSECLYEQIPGCCDTDEDCDGVPCMDGWCCVPDCDDGEGGTLECGPDGCGGSCGTCEGAQTCNEDTGLCICETCCLDSTECAALEICLDPGSGDTVCTALTPIFQASFDDETPDETSAMFTYSWPEYSPGWLVFDATDAPDFAVSPSNSLRYNKYKADGWMEFVVDLPDGQDVYLSFMIRCPFPPAQNWTMDVTGDGGTLTTVTSLQVCGIGMWYHVTADVTTLGAGSHAFRIEIDNEAFGTIYLDDVVILPVD